MTEAQALEDFCDNAKADNEKWECLGKAMEF
jgi:hypothetical protein